MPTVYKFFIGGAIPKCYILDMEKIELHTMPLGDRIKAYEHQFTDFAIDPSIPFIARVDGRAFHTFTKKMDRPFDARFTRTMCDTARALTEALDPVVSYVQSDEITLVFKPTNEPPFSGKLSKLNSNIASMATYWFNKSLPIYTPVAGIALFDCRVFNVPDEWEAVNALRFRYRDAFRNSVSAAARAKFGHKATLNKNTDQKLEMLGSEWDLYPDAARFGAFFHKVNVVKPVTVDKTKMTPEEAAKIPDTCIRSEIQEFIVEAEGKLANLNDRTWGIDAISNAPGVIFDGERAIYEEKE